MYFISKNTFPRSRRAFTAAVTQECIFSADSLYVSSPAKVTEVRHKRSAFPGRAMMFHGYFGSGGHHPYHNPVTSRHDYDSHNARPYDPRGSTTAFTAGNTVSAESSYHGGGGGGRDCRECEGAKKPANGDDNKKNGNGHPTNGKGPYQHQVPSDILATSKKPVNGNGQEHKPVWNENVGYADGNGNGGYVGDQPADEETPKGQTLPPAPPSLPVDPEGAKKGNITLILPSSGMSGSVGWFRTDVSVPCSRVKPSKKKSGQLHP